MRPPSGTDILVRQGAYEESISLTSAKTLVVKGGYDSEYSGQTANATFIQGLGQTTIQATGGSLKFQMLSMLPSGSYSLAINITGSGQVHVFTFGRRVSTGNRGDPHRRGGSGIGVHRLGRRVQRDRTDNPAYHEWSQGGVRKLFSRIHRAP